MKTLYEENKKIYYFIYQTEYIFAFIDYISIFKKKNLLYLCKKWSLTRKDFKSL